jgi:fructose-specific phosphotransferase system component IIB
MKTIRYFILMLVLLASNQTKAQNNTTAINQVLQGYLGVEKALVNDDIRAANKAATAMANSINEVIATRLNAGQKAIWTKYSEKLRYNSEHISESTSIDHQREHFASLSNDMYVILKSFKSHPTLYRQYCPMKKQYWLNASSEIQNPYYGKQMPDCGKVTETIKGEDFVQLIN